MDQTTAPAPPSYKSSLDFARFLTPFLIAVLDLTTAWCLSLLTTAPDDCCGRFAPTAVNEPKQHKMRRRGLGSKHGIGSQQDVRALAITPISPPAKGLRSKLLLSVPFLFVLFAMNLIQVRNARTLDTNHDAESDLAQARSEILFLVSNVAELERELNHLRQQMKLDVDKVYLDMLEEAERRSARDFESSHQEGRRGIVVGPIDGKFKYTLQALKNARRIRNIIPGDSEVKLAIITSKDHVDILNGCKRDSSTWKEPLTNTTCRLWNNGTLFDDIVLNKEPVWTDNFHVTKRLGSRYIMISIGGSLLAPYRQSLMLDSDSYPCPGVEKLFDILRPYSKQLWPLPSTAPVDLATSFEQYAWQDKEWRWVFGRGTGLHSDFQYFADRNCGTLLYNFENPLTHTFAHFVQLVAAHVINNVATHRDLVMGEQTLFKIALYLFQKARPEFHEEQFPSHVVCRTYPDDYGAGIDGARNGMYPIKDDGTPCSDCQCTPCLINHNHGSHFVTVNGRKGWGSDHYIAKGGNSLPLAEWDSAKSEETGNSRTD